MFAVTGSPPAEFPLPFLEFFEALLTERTVDSIQRCPHQMKRDSDINLIQNNLDPSCATDFLNLSYDSLFCFLVALLHIPSTAHREKQPYSVPAKSLYLWVYLGNIADLLFFSHLLRIAFMNMYCMCCVIQLHHISEKTILPFTSNSTPTLHAQMYADTQTVFHVIAIYPITDTHY